MPEENKKGNGKNGIKKEKNGESKGDLSNIKELKDFRASSNINKDNIKDNKDNTNEKKDTSYTEYYKIKTGLELQESFRTLKRLH